jgi:hypothetical protein
VRDVLTCVRGPALAPALIAALALGGCKEWKTRWQPAVADASADAALALRPPDGAPDTLVACGRGHGPCPLETWMETELSAPLQTRDWAHLSRAIARLAADAPEHFPRWRHWSTRSAEAARARNSEAVRVACKGCHNEYRDEYRALMPARPAPP